MARLAKEKQNNPLKAILGIIPEKPLHLSVYKTKETPDFDSSCILEDLTVKAELLEGIAEFNISAIIPCQNQEKKAKIIITDNKTTIQEKTSYIFIINAKQVSTALEPYFAPTRRKADTPGHLAILAWASVRVCEYICDRFSFTDVEISGNDIYWLSAEYASSICSVLCQEQYAKSEIDQNFVNKNQKLFSPRFARNVKK